jgi:hypothetical protein
VADLRNTWLTERAVRATVSLIADAPHMLDAVPRGGVLGASLCCQLLLRVAHTSSIAVRRADGALARDASVSREARTLTRLPVAHALIGTLYRGVCVVGALYLSHPRSVSVRTTMSQEWSAR